MISATTLPQFGVTQFTQTNDIDDEGCTWHITLVTHSNQELEDNNVSPATEEAFEQSSEQLGEEGKDLKAQVVSWLEASEAINLQWTLYFWQHEHISEKLNPNTVVEYNRYAQEYNQTWAQLANEPIERLRRQVEAALTLAATRGYLFASHEVIMDKFDIELKLRIQRHIASMDDILPSFRADYMVSTYISEGNARAMDENMSTRLYLLEYEVKVRMEAERERVRAGTEHYIGRLYRGRGQGNSGRRLS
jgi:hypothetical protein